MKRKGKRHHTCQRKGAKGFSLVELSIVLVIIALLIGGMMVPLSAQRDMQNANETQKQLAEAREALLGFAIGHCRLPCPANPALASGDADLGLEYAANGSGCSGPLEGVLPWVTLGVPETDAWGHRLSYRVSGGFAKAASCASPNQAFSLDSDGSISVFSASSGSSLATKIPAIIVSHGKNGHGAYLRSGTKRPDSTDADEKENTNADSGEKFVSKTQTESFDDLVVWVNLNILRSRMISAGRLP